MPREQLELMAEAGAEVVNCMRVLAKSGDNVVAELLRGEETFYEWDHYPKGDVYDHETHSQYYYHAHPSDERPGEHGHFHTFLRPKGMPPDIEPAPVPDYEPPEDEDDALSHIIGISMDKFGVPIRLFTTNRWVTGEVWYAAEDVIRLSDCFDIDLAPPSWPVNRWVSAMVRLFHPQLSDLVRKRDARVAEWVKVHPEENAFEDRNLEIVSEVDVSVDDQMRAITRALERPKRKRRSG